MTYSNVAPPKTTANNLKLLVTKLTKDYEQFNGTVNITNVPDTNKAEIILVKNKSEDDSVGATEYKMIAEKKGHLWVITNNKTHWKCLRNFITIFWTTSACS